MAYTLVYSVVAVVCFVLILLVAFFQNSVDDKHLLATPSIPKTKGILTSLASARINAPPDEVFEVMLKYKDYSKWSCFSQHEWKEVTDEGLPYVGSTGSFKLSVEGFNERQLPVKLTLLDREKRIISERTTSYPTWLLGSERVQEVIPVEGHPRLSRVMLTRTTAKRLSEYRTWHTLEGLAAYALLFTAQPELEETQRMIADGLKAYMEKSRSKTI